MIFLYFCILCQVCGRTLAIDHVDRVKAPKIIGGRAVPPLGAPFMVFLYKVGRASVSTSYFCVVFIIFENAKLTFL